MAAEILVGGANVFQHLAMQLAEGGQSFS